jgi:hypothetical protein
MGDADETKGLYEEQYDEKAASFDPEWNPVKNPHWGEEVYAGYDEKALAAGLDEKGLPAGDDVDAARDPGWNLEKYPELNPHWGEEVYGGYEEKAPPADDLEEKI